MIKINECPKFDRCSAPICPLDGHWRNSVYYEGEPVCLYLRERSKGVDLARMGLLPLGMPLIIEHAYRQIIHTAQIGVLLGHGSLRRALKKTAKSSSMILSGKRLQGANKTEAEVTPQLEIRQRKVVG